MVNAYLRNFATPALAGFITMISAGTLSAQSWENVGNPGFAASGAAAGVANWQRLMVDENDTLYLAYNDEGLGFGSPQGTVMKFNGTTWETVGNPGFTPAFAHHSDFAFGPGDTIYYSFADGSSAAMSRGAVMQFDGTSWTSIGTDLTQGACQYSSLAVDSAGILYFGAIDLGHPQGGYVVKKYDGSNWTIVGTSPIVADSAAYSDMGLNRDGVLYIAYRDQTESPGKVRVKKFDGSNWVNVGDPLLATTGPGAGPAMDIYIAFDLAGTPYVSYSHTFMGPPRISVERFNGTSWELVGDPQFSSGPFESALFSSLALPKSAPYVAYQYGGSVGNKANVMRFNNGTNAWENVGPVGISDGVAAHTSIALDANANVYVAYYDGAHDGKNTVKKYTVCETAVIDLVSVSDTLLCSPGDTVTLAVAGTLNDATNWYWYSGSCSGTLLETGDTIKVVPTAETSYYVRGYGGCLQAAGCQEITVDFAVDKPLISLSDDMFTSSAPSGNQWFLNGNPLPGATGTTHQASEEGWYFVRVSDGDCSNDSDSMRYETSSIAQNINDQQLRLYPIPVIDHLNVALEAGVPLAHMRIRIFDNLGRMVFEQPLKNQRERLDLSSLEAGLYFAEISNGTFRKSVKLVK